MRSTWIAVVGIACLGLMGLAAIAVAAIAVYQGHEIPPSVVGIGASAGSTLGVVVIALIHAGDSGSDSGGGSGRH